MEVNIVNELGRTELIIEEAKIYEENYQINMLRECDIPGLLSVIGCGIDDRSQYIYDISGMQSMAKIYEKTPMDECSIRQFSKELLELLEVIKHHMLDINHVLLEPEYIYKHNDQYYFCYYPLCEREVKSSFHQLSQYFVQHIDYGVVETVILACGIHKATMEEEYDLAQLLQENSAISRVKRRINEAITSRELNKEALWENLESTNIKDLSRGPTSKSIYDIELTNDSDVANEQDEINSSDDKEYAYGPIKVNKLMSKVAETSLSKIWGREKHSPNGMESVDKSAQKKKETWGDWDALLKQEGYR